MAITSEDILRGLKKDETAEPELLVDPSELRRSIIEEQVQDLRREATKGPKPPAITPKVPNPKQEAITGSQTPRTVGFPHGFLETGAEALGGSVGATAGAAYGAQLGAPLGPYGIAVGGIGGGLIGAGLGLAGTRAAVEGGKALVGAREPITADEAISSGQRALVEGIAGEGLARGLMGIPQAKRFLMNRLLAGGIQPTEKALYQEAQKLGIHLTPSTLTDSKAPKLVEHTLRRSISGGGKFEARDIENEVNLRRATDQWADVTLGNYEGPVEQGLLIQKALTNDIIPEHKALVGNLYKRLDEQTAGARIVGTEKLYTDLQGVRASLARRGDTYKGAIATLDDVLERMSKEGPSTGLTVRKVETESTEEAPSKLLGLKVKQKSKGLREPVALTFSQAQEIRSIIGEELSGKREALPGADKAKLSKAYALMTEEMGKAAIDFSKATGKDINLSWLLADTMNRRGKELFNESVVAKVIERNPEDVVKTVFQKGAITETRDLVRALETRPETLGKYRRAVVEDLIQESVDKSTGRVIGADFAKAARKRGEPVLKETFGENYAAFNKILEITERMPRGSQAGMLWFEQGLYVSGMLGVLGGHALESTGTAVTAAAIPSGWFIGTRRLASILTDPRLTNKLLEVRSLNPKTQAFTRIMSELGAIRVGESGQPVQQPGPTPGQLLQPEQTLQP